MVYAWSYSDHGSETDSDSDNLSVQSVPVQSLNVVLGVNGGGTEAQQDFKGQYSPNHPVNLFLQSFPNNSNSNQIPILAPVTTNPFSVVVSASSSTANVNSTPPKKNSVNISTTKSTNKPELKNDKGIEFDMYFCL